MCLETTVDYHITKRFKSTIVYHNALEILQYNLTMSLNSSPTRHPPGASSKREPRRLLGTNFSLIKQM
jgi:hypothetical protein